MTLEIFAIAWFATGLLGVYVGWHLDKLLGETPDEWIPGVAFIYGPVLLIIASTVLIGEVLSRRKRRFRHSYRLRRWATRYPKPVDYSQYEEYEE